MSAAAALLAVFVLVLPASAGAAGRDCETPTGDQYCPEAQVLTGSGTSSEPGEPADADAGALPFTGFDLALSLVVAAGLLGAGVALLRVNGSRSAE